MTQAGPTPRQAIFDAIKAEVLIEDKGLDVVALKTDWGMTLKFQRQNKTLPWRVTFNSNGESGIYKPETASLPRVQQSYGPNQLLELRDQIITYIRNGYI